ncbi:hypothetical protein DY000_02015552 [Brassica cretica]|uniref:CCHC-type domain-containing protein n=1 Tax=Brassica cretica TaxID=69181 RepID=A0ABQ7CXL4_BRACR|nr:hypothetical protein DY000_02015552 [Brassica cretica]
MDFCMPDCMRGYGQSVDRLDRSLVWSIKRLRAVTPSTLSEVFVWPVSGQRVRASLGSFLVAWSGVPTWLRPGMAIFGDSLTNMSSFQMPPKRRARRAQTARDAREAGVEHEQPAVPQPAAPPIDQDALRQIVQDAARHAAQDAVQQIAREAAREAAQEAARVAAQEVARQMAAVQQGPQVQVQQGPQIRVQQVPPVQVHQDHQILGQHDHQDPVQQGLPPPPPRPQVYPVYDERFYRLTCQMRNMDMEHFSGTVDVVAAHDWKLALERKLEIIECPPESSLRLTMQLGDLVEKAAEQQAGLAEEQKLAKEVHVKSGKAPESHSRGGDQSGLPTCPRCRRRHSGKCPRCFTCGQQGHISKYCQVKPVDTVPVRQIAAPAPAVAQVCFGCNQPGHFIRDRPRRGNAALPPSPKRLAIAPLSGSPELDAGEIVCLDHVQLATTDNRPRPPSCYSRRDEAIDTDNAAIGVRTKPLEPPEVLPLYARETHAPSQSAGAAAYSGHAPPSPTTVCRRRRARPSQLRRSRKSPPPSPPANFPVRRRRPPPSPPVTDTGDSPVTQSTRTSQLG